MCIFAIVCYALTMTSIVLNPNQFSLSLYVAEISTTQENNLCMCSGVITRTRFQKIWLFEGMDVWTD